MLAAPRVEGHGSLEKAENLRQPVEHWESNQRQIFCSMYFSVGSNHSRSTVEMVLHTQYQGVDAVSLDSYGYSIQSAQEEDQSKLSNLEEHEGILGTRV